MRIERTAPDKLKPFFLQLVRRSFDQLHMGDNQIADYVATLLADFSHSDKWLMLRDAQGKKLHSVVEMVVSAMGPDGQNRVIGERAVRKYVGDYTLFMSGLFRTFVQKRGFLDYYLQEGKRSYEAVSKGFRCCAERSVDAAGPADGARPGGGDRQQCRAAAGARRKI